MKPSAMPSAGVFATRALGTFGASSLGATVLFLVFSGWVMRPAASEWVGVTRVAALLGLGSPLLVLCGGAFVWRSLRALRPDLQEPDTEQRVALDGEALVRVHRAPLAIALPVFVVVALAAVVDGSGLWRWSGLSGARSVAVGFAAVGSLQLGLHISVIVWRDLIWSKLPRVPPSVLKRALRPTMAHRLALRVLSVAGFCAAWALAAFLVVAGDLASGARVAAAVGAASYAVVALAWLLAFRLGRRTVMDLRRLTAFVRGLRSDREWTTTGELPILGAPLATRPAEDVNRAIVGLAERFAKIANEEARVRAVLERAERLRPRFMAYVSHDLRGPLNSIKGFAEILSRDEQSPLSGEQAESLATIQESGEELLRLVTEIIDTTRLEAGRIELHRSWTPTVTLLTEAIGHVRQLRRRRPVAIETHLTPGLPAVFVDRARVVQAMVSVLAFVQHPLEQGAIHVSVREEADDLVGRAIRFEVRSSPAVDFGQAAQLFEALRPARGPSGRRVAGLGVGLALARGLVELHGGRLEYQAGLQPVGGTFVLALPIVEDEAPR